MSDLASFFGIDNPEGLGPAVVVCEHASNHFPPPWDKPGLSDAQLVSHIAWDPGALEVARGLARALHAPLVHAKASRLIFDLNRPPHSPAAMTERSEAHAIPFNLQLSRSERRSRTQAHYIPFHAALADLLARRLARGLTTALITVHSFTPVYFGKPREVEFGLIHDSDARLAKAIAQRDIGLLTRLNEPYSAADGVTHTLARHATPFGLPHAMLEIRNDLIADEKAQTAMVARLAPVIRSAIDEVA
ncbi:N-formylglutamate amidohydrolase [Paracoccus aestuariivivens]|uniref:N-formylglutamate amidohydrolase n=1 Tax=Paracoccus aestuariivivens TaxID=1820333 RepID=A0A6L6J7K9_9RHOB|nr:N-formylglutamate amidohydrolase [Paracoccus aestuariivivens]MTH77158.1 N-formylglutamate amidohydrolase [Paracoccus aestuariivivens]